MAAAAEVPVGAAAGYSWLQRPVVRFALHALTDPPRGHLPLPMSASRTRHHIDLIQGLFSHYIIMCTQ